MQRIHLATSLGVLGALVGVFSWFTAGAPGPRESRDMRSYFETYVEEVEGGDMAWLQPPLPGEEVPPVAFTSRASHPVMEAGSFSQEVFVWVGLRAAAVPDSPRPDMNLALVIDRSGSMGSEKKLHYAKAAAEQLVQRLRPSDHLAIVTYDDRIDTLVPSQPVGEGADFLRAIRGLSPGNSTDLHGGMVHGYEEVLRHFEGERLNQVLLISDGLANHGVTDRNQIEQRASKCRDRGVRISTMGMGLDYDEDLLVGISASANGNYYYVDHAEVVGQHLEREIDMLSKITARDLEVRVKLADGVQLKQVYGYRSSMEGRTAVIGVNDMYSDQNRKIVLRLEVTGGVAGETRKLVDTALDYYDALERKRRRVQEPVAVRFSENLEEVEAEKDLVVLGKVEVVRNAVALDEAMQRQKAGDVSGAQELLAARYLNSKTFNDTELKSGEVARILKRMKKVMHELEARRHDQKALRDLQLDTALRGLGYIGD